MRPGDPLYLGQTYRTQDGKAVTMRTLHNAGTEYETMLGTDGLQRYSRRIDDSGRVTGTNHDYSDPRNIAREPPK